MIPHCVTPWLIRTHDVSMRMSQCGERIHSSDSTNDFVRPLWLHARNGSAMRREHPFDVVTVSQVDHKTRSPPASQVSLSSLFRVYSASITLRSLSPTLQSLSSLWILHITRPPAFSALRSFLRWVSSRKTLRASILNKHKAT
jgi:hypothetical protein